MSKGNLKLVKNSSLTTDLEQLPQWAEALGKALMSALRERDPYTYGHCRRVAKMASLLARSAGLNENLQKVCEYSALFHDLGKISIPDRILNKPGRLTEEEDAIMRQHPEKSVEIVKPLAEVEFFKSTLPGILHHHERVDGLGYPHGLKGDEIPLTARVVLVVDTFDAMTTSRPYRKGLPEEIAFKELHTFSGRQFDTDLVKIFTQAYRTWGVLEEEITQEFIAANFKRAA